MNESINDNWLPIPGYEGRYEVSSSGKVRTVARMVKLKPPFNERWFPSVELRRHVDGRDGAKGKTRYEQVNLHSAGRHTSKSFKVHVLVMISFKGPRPDGMQIRHLDGNSLNNSVKNLEWGTHQQNMNDRATHGNHKIYGEDNLKSKLTEGQVLYVRASNERGTVLAARFGVTKQSIYQIRWGKVWKHLLPGSHQIRRAMGNA